MNFYYRYFQTNVLINFFIPLRRAEEITWENFVQANGIPVVQKGDPAMLDESFHM